MRASVIIPTVDRREPLIRAIEGCLSQGLPADEWEIIVVDNSAAGGQAWVRERFPVRYVHEPSSGLANARNRGVREAQGEFVVFLDDDERPVDTGWLSNLVAVAIESDADVTFGPVLPEFETPPAVHRAFATDLYTRKHAVPSGARLDVRTHKLGTGNSCFRAYTCFRDRAPFDPRFNASGGEDVDLFARLGARGCSFAWAPQAPVLEFVPSARLDPGYYALRRFRQGQQRTSLQLAASPRWDLVLFWMAAGSAQAGYHGAMSLLALLAGMSEKSQEHRIRAWGGLGKMFWQSRFSGHAYMPPPSPP